MNNDIISIIYLSCILLLCFSTILIIPIYDTIRFYWLKPKYRINKSTHQVEYYQSKHNRWWPVCGWDNSDSDRVFTLHSSGNEFECKYKGPGRYVHIIDGKLSQKQLREMFPYKTTKELYEQQAEYINNEDIIISKIIHEKFNL